MKKYDQQNLLVSVGVIIIQLSLLWTGAHSDTVGLLLSAIAFSFIGLTVYALIHEGCHQNLHTNNKVNSVLSTLLGFLFPVSFTFLETAHVVHHKNNRTDNELFDYYYADDNLLIKYSQWYSILAGVYPPIIPLGSILLAIMPKFFSLTPWKKAKSSEIIFDRNLFNTKVIKKIRWEVLSGIFFWAAIIYLLELRLLPLLIMYMAFWVNWSTRQYVSHAFSPRDVIDGAWNLKVGAVMGWIFLNGQWDKVHHQQAAARWQQLPELGKMSETPIAYWPQYFSLWKGPRKNFEPAPKALDE